MSPPLVFMSLRTTCSASRWAERDSACVRTQIATDGYEPSALGRGNSTTEWGRGRAESSAQSLLGERSLGGDCCCMKGQVQSPSYLPRNLKLRPAAADTP